eukprot:g46322.t1
MIKGRAVDVIYVDFGKAFDKVLRSRLIQKVIQQDLDKLEPWAEKWQMEFNLDKYELISFGMSNAGGKYAVYDRSQRSINIQRDLGIQVHSSLKMAIAVDKMVK